MRNLAVGITVVVGVCLATACASVPRAPVAVTRAVPNTDAILRLVGRFSVAHACPVGATIALTNGHVTDYRPFDASVDAFPLVWSDGLGHEGALRALSVSGNRDLATMMSPTPFARWYPIATAAPAPGQRLVTLGFDFRKRRTMYAPRVFEVTVLRVVARNVIFEPGTVRGASGACVLNSRGEVVAVNAWVQTPDDGDGSVGVAVGVWGEEFGPR